MSNPDEDKPEVIAYRLKIMEQKVDDLHRKLDEMREAFLKTACPQPGSCVPLIDAVKRLEILVQKHESELHSVKTDITAAKAGAKVLTTGAVALGSGLGAVVSIALQWFANK